MVAHRSSWPILLLVIIALQLIVPHSLAFTVRESSARRSPHLFRQEQVRFPPRDGRTHEVKLARRYEATHLSATPKKNDNEKESPSEETDLDELSQEMLLQRLGMDPNESSPLSVLDAMELPIPLFTSLVIFIGSTVLTIYGIYVGIMGFPNDGP